MKNHAIIPIFIPHLGCPHACVFCDQAKITARSGAPSEDTVRDTIETWLTTLSGCDRPEVLELAFYGGSFTGIPLSDQEKYLSIAKSYKDAGKIDKIHLSTRPDYIDDSILSLLKRFSVDVIELGCQSFDDEVLRLSKRGHTAEDIRRAARAIKAAGFELGIQLMIGLPGDSPESCIFSALEAVKLSPSLARLYPTVIISGTELEKMCLSGTHTPISQDEAVHRTKEMYKILRAAGITIMRVGLKSSDIMHDKEGSAALYDTFHPAFRQLVEGEIARECIMEKLDALIGSCDKTGEPPRIISVLSSPSWFSNMVGHRNCNRKHIESLYPAFRFRFGISGDLAPGSFRCELW